MKNAKVLFYAFWIIVIISPVGFFIWYFEKHEEQQGEVQGEESHYTYEIVNIFQHDSLAFTQGLVYYDGYLYEGTGLYGKSAIRKVDLSSGEILKEKNLEDQYFGEGITIFEDKIYQITWHSQKGFVYDIEDFRILHEFTYPTEGWGLTHNNSELILSDGSSTLYFINPRTFEVTKEILVFDANGSIENLNELEFINGKIYANVWMEDYIIIIDPDNGKVTGRIDFTGIINREEYKGIDVLNGIAYDSERDRLFVTGKLWPKILEVRLITK